MQTKRESCPISSGVYAERIPDNLLLEPIEYIFADHCRQADMCGALKELAKQASSSPPDQRTAKAILNSLDGDLSMHIADEEMDLFPHLSARALPEDHFPELLRLLDKEHKRDCDLVDEVRSDLKLLAQGKPLKNSEQFCCAVSTLAANHLSHLNWENTVLLPLARRRLTDKDLKAMSRTMTARHGAA